jgi:ferritin-like metal-binding protein YciE
MTAGMESSPLRAVYIDQLRDLHSGESQLATALKQLSKAATDPSLKALYEEHRRETMEHRKQVAALLKERKAKPGNHACKGIMGITEEANAVISGKQDAKAKDAALIAAAQRAEHYEIAGYGTAASMASLLGLDSDAQTLHDILNQERAADEKLSVLAQSTVNPAALGEGVRDRSTTVSSNIQGDRTMAGRYDDDYRGGQYEGRGYGNRGGYGHPSYDDEERGSRGGYDGRSEGGRRSSHMQDRDEYGQFTGYGGRGQSQGNYGSQGTYGSQGGYGGRQSYDIDDRGYENRGGMRQSWPHQDRDEYGQFTGYGNQSRGYSGNRSSYDDDRGSRYDGRSEGGRRSSHMQDRDEYGQFTGYGGRGDQDRDYGERGGGRGSRSQGGYR